MAPRPLDGVRVLDLTRLLPGAHLTLVLADLGADVVKIEDPRGGDPARTLPPATGGTSAYFRVMNRNKRSVTLNLQKPEAAGVLDALLARADVLVESFRPQTARRLGVDAAALRARHPRLIHASMSGFGQTGPSAARAAHDINFEAISGLLSLGRDDSRPDVPRLLVGDIGAAMYTAAGILAALYQRERTGAGAAVEVSIHEATLSWLQFPAARLLAGDVDVRQARGVPSDKSSDATRGVVNHLPLTGDHACYNIYRTADDRYLTLGALEPKFWAAFCERLGRRDLAPLQYAGGDGQARVLAEVRALMLTRSAAEWLSLFSDIDVCLALVNTTAQALADPHIIARGAVAHHGGFAYITTPIAVTPVPTEEAPDAARRLEICPAPALGAHTDEVLSEAGLTDADRAPLRERGVI